MKILAETAAVKMIKGISARASIVGLAAATLMITGTAVAGTGTPEIDPGMAVGGLTVFAVGVVLLIERYRARE